MHKPVVLLAAEDQGLHQIIKRLLLRQDCRVAESPRSTEATGYSHERNGDLVIIGSSADHPWGGVALAAKIREGNDRVPIILITANSSEELVIAAIRAGITDYFKLPLEPEELTRSIARCVSRFRTQEISAHRETVPPESSDSRPMIGESSSIREIRAYIERLAPSDINVLITGETGTGKELAAELIHRGSLRRQKPFVCINCAAIPDTLLESELFGHERGAFTGAHARKEGKLKIAEGGTAFFDEIGDMSLSAQAKILRAIEGKQVHRLGGSASIPLNFRFIAATNQDLERSITEGKFRKDLYFRLNVARINLPPLRDRKEDIPALCEHYLRELNLQFGRSVEGFTEEAAEWLLRYEWPGNVRELRNLLAAAFVNLPSRRIALMDLPDQFRKQLRDVEGLSQDERGRLLSTLFSTNWNKSKAAQKLHWSRMTLYRKMAKYNLNGAAVLS
jgi:DNA-binding NtrC family response regulator